jgi:hypothetical protein
MKSHRFVTMPHNSTLYTHHVVLVAGKTLRVSQDETVLWITPCLRQRAAADRLQASHKGLLAHIKLHYSSCLMANPHSVAYTAHTSSRKVCKPNVQLCCSSADLCALIALVATSRWSMQCPSLDSVTLQRTLDAHTPHGACLQYIRQEP